MNKLLVPLMLLPFAGFTGCDDTSPPSEQVQAQTEYDFTITDDRARWREDGMAYQGSVGPYAIYRIVGASPRLIGPYVRRQPSQGFAMLCGGTKYFTGERNPLEARMTLHGGSHGQLPLIRTAQLPEGEGGCSPPKDTFGNPLPDGGEGGSDDMAPAGPPVFVPPGTTGDDGGMFINPNVDDPTAGGQVHQMIVTLNPAPPRGSTVLVRRVALTADRQHNGSHVIPNICCKDGQCTLSGAQ